MFQQLVYFMACLAVGGAVVQELTIFSGPEQTGESIRFTQHQPNLAEWNSFIFNAQSYCYTGLWEWFQLRDYQAFRYTFEYRGEEKNCVNGSSTAFLSYNGSVRYMGANDTLTPAISFYTGDSVVGGAFGGQEFLVLDELDELEFRLGSWAISGFSRWTFWDEKDFQGDSACVVAKDVVDSDYDAPFYPVSVRLGCDSK